MNNSTKYFNLGRAILFIVALILVGQTLFTFNAMSLAPLKAKPVSNVVKLNNKQTGIYARKEDQKEKTQIKDIIKVKNSNKKEVLIDN